MGSCNFELCRTRVVDINTGRYEDWKLLPAEAVLSAYLKAKYHCYIDELEPHKINQLRLRMKWSKRSVRLGSFSALLDRKEETL